MKRGRQVLACCPSNTAVDNLLEALKNNVKGIKLCRAGLMGKMNALSKEFSLDALMNKVEEKKEFNGENVSLFRTLDSINVILTTNTGAGDGRIVSYLKLKKKRDKSLVIAIDEAAQATEPLCWIPIRFGSKVILAGDHMQLQPTILSPEAVEKGLAVTMFERLMQLKLDKNEAIPRQLLRIQYRMSPLIMSWCSQAMYDNKLIAAESVKNNLRPFKEIADKLNNKALKMLTSKDMIMIDTAGYGVIESSASSHSKYNLG